MRGGLRRMIGALIAAGLAGAAGYSAQSATYELALPEQGAIGLPTVHLTAKGEILLDTARRHDLGYTELMAANRGADPWASPAGTAIVLPLFHILPDAPREGIVINLAAQRLFYYPKDTDRVVTFPIGVSRPGHETPKGRTSVVRKAADPIWFPTPAHREANPNLPAAVAPGPGNPLGRHALYLGWPRYLVHGTNKPDGIGRTVSSGCIRLYPEDIKQLFDMVPVGTPVHVVQQEAAAAWIGDKLYAQVFPTREQAEEIGVDGAFSTRTLSTELVERIISVTEMDGAEIDWDAVERAGLERTGLPVLVGRAPAAF